MTSNPSLLIVSFSNLSRDARLLKQIRLFLPDYEVTTCGFGPQPIDGVKHLEVTPRYSKWERRLQAVLLRLHAFWLVYWLFPPHRHARRLLRGRRFDGVLANDIDAMRIALGVTNGSRVHLDLHEFWPGVYDNIPQWTRLRAPYYEWQLRRWGRRAQSATMVNRPLAELYQERFGIACGVVTNSTEYQQLDPVEVQKPLRLVHSGAAKPNRKIEVMMEAVAACSTDVTLDLLLIGEGTEYYKSLERLAVELGDRIRILPPKPHAELVATLNHYDVGISFFPPVTTNIRFGLPNKFFDYVQARLAILTGPTPPMVELVDEYGLGAVTADFTTEALVETINSLDAENVAGWKRNADAAASPLSAERQNAGWVRPITAIVNRSDGSA